MSPSHNSEDKRSHEKAAPPGTPSSTSATRKADAERELGVPGYGLPHEWHSRGYLPHRDRLGLLQSITFRLADSLPQSKLTALEEALKTHPAEKRDLERRKQIEQWLDSGMGCCALKHPKMAACMENALLHFDGERYRLIAWCIMPNHVHVLVEPLTELSLILKSWKSYTGRWGLAKNAELELGVPGKRFWMRDYWDRFIRNERHLRDVVLYIHQNPVKAGLCHHPEEWHWSSARPSPSPPGNPDNHIG